MVGAVELAVNVFHGDTRQLCKKHENSDNWVLMGDSHDGYLVF